MSKLDEIKARLKAATPGPWKHIETCGCSGEVTIFECYDERDRLPVPQVVNNAEFIAHAPEDVAWLIKELEKAVQHRAALMDGIEANMFIHQEVQWPACVRNVFKDLENMDEDQ